MSAEAFTLDEVPPVDLATLDDGQLLRHRIATPRQIPLLPKAARASRGCALAVSCSSRRSSRRR